MSGHYTEHCRHGLIMGQCRCPGPGKTVRHVACGPACNEETRGKLARVIDRQHAEGMAELAEAFRVREEVAWDSGWWAGMKDAKTPPEAALTPNPHGWKEDAPA